MGKDGGSGGKHEARLARSITKQAWPKAKRTFLAGEDMLQEAMPIYGQAMDWAGETLGSPYDVGDYTESPLWGPGKLAAERAYGQTQQNILSNMPAGGGLQDALVQADIARGTNLTNLAGRIGMDQLDRQERALERALNIGVNAPGVGANIGLQALGMGTGQAGVLGNIAGTRAQAKAQEQAGKYGKGGDIGSGAGFVLGNKIGGGGGGGAAQTAASLASLALL